jgi:hypothetical protein
MLFVYTSFKLPLLKTSMRSAKSKEQYKNIEAEGTEPKQRQPSGVAIRHGQATVIHSRDRGLVYLGVIQSNKGYEMLKCFNAK